MVPPRLVRRLVVAPIVVVIALALLVLFPALAVVAAVLGLVHLSRPGRMRGLRLLWFAMVWLTGETAALFACLGLWLASGFGGRMRTEPYQARNYATIGWFLDHVYRAAEHTFGLRMVIEEPEATPAERLARLTRPVIVLSRYHRRPRVVMKATLQLDPMLDVIANRVPNVFIRAQDAGQQIFTEHIERLADGLGDDGALVIFPEGANWTPGRWRRGIQRLRDKGRGDLATRAAQMPNLLPPREGGVLAALRACPAADVVFVAHAGLDEMVTVADVWRDLPINQTVVARWWRVPAGEVPRDAGHEAQVKWLFDWWQLIDAWISDHRPAGAPGSAGPAGSPSAPDAGAPEAASS